MTIARPTTTAAFATDATFTSGSESGLSPRLDPGSARGQGIFAESRIAARWLNALFGIAGDWIAYLDSIAAVFDLGGTLTPAAPVNIAGTVNLTGAGGASVTGVSGLSVTTTLSANAVAASGNLSAGGIATFSGTIAASHGVNPRFLIGPDADTTIDPTVTDSVHTPATTANRTYTLANTVGGSGRVVYFSVAALGNNVVIKDFAGNTLATLRGNSTQVGGVTVMLTGASTAKVVGLFTVP